LEIRVDEERKETIEIHERCGLLPRILVVIGKKETLSVYFNQ
jgi:hypothetical protein